MKRWWHKPIFVVLASLCVFYGCSQESSKKKSYRVGIFSGLDSFNDIALGFKEKMKTLGYIEGKNIAYEMQTMSGREKEDQKKIQKFIDGSFDLIFCFPTEAAVLTKKITAGTKIPILFAMAGIEGTGLVDTIYKPGGYISGVRFPGPELVAKRLEILKELVPSLKRVFITYDPHYPTIPAALEELQRAAINLNLTLVKEPVTTLSQLKAAYQKRIASGQIDVDAILIMPEAFTLSPEPWALITRFAAEHALPIAGTSCHSAYGGAVFGYSSDFREIGGLAASMADKIFNKALISEMMVVTPDSYLFLNYAQAKKLGLKVGDGFLSRADKIIQ